MFCDSFFSKGLFSIGKLEITSLSSQGPAPIFFFGTHFLAPIFKNGCQKWVPEKKMGAFLLLIWVPKFGFFSIKKSVWVPKKKMGAKKKNGCQKKKMGAEKKNGCQKKNWVPKKKKWVLALLMRLLNQ
jgi:hypothetical protein